MKTYILHDEPLVLIHRTSHGASRLRRALRYPHPDGVSPALHVNEQLLCATADTRRATVRTNRVRPPWIDPMLAFKYEAKTGHVAHSITDVVSKVILGK